MLERHMMECVAAARWVDEMKRRKVMLVSGRRLRMGFVDACYRLEL